MLDQVAPWITPAIVLVVFAWLLKDKRHLTSRLDALDEWLRAVEGGLTELRGRFDGIVGQHGATEIVRGHSAIVSRMTSNLTRPPRRRGGFDAVTRDSVLSRSGPHSKSVRRWWL